MTDNNPTPQDTVRVPRSLIEALRKALGDHDADGGHWNQMLIHARAVVAAVEQAAEGGPACRCWDWGVESCPRHRITPPPVSPSEDDKDARIDPDVISYRAEVDILRRSNERLNERLEQACAERDALAAKVRAGLALADEWAYKGEFGWGPWQAGEGPDQEGDILDRAATRLRAALSGV